MAGLRAGDVIVAIDEEDVDTMDDLRRKILGKRVGEKLMVRFARGNDVFEVYVQLASAE